MAQARLWAERVLRCPGDSQRARLDRLFETAFCRPPTDQEARTCLDFLDTRQDASAPNDPHPDNRDLRAWSDLCHVLFNMKEFIFVE
jgi:hypothetical protein